MSALLLAFNIYGSIEKNRKYIAIRVVVKGNLYLFYN